MAALLTKPPGLPWLTPLAALLTSLISISQAVYFNAARLRDLSVLATQWNELAEEYRILWAKWEDSADMEFSQLWAECESIMRREKKDQTGFRMNEKRLDAAYSKIEKLGGCYEGQR